MKAFTPLAVLISALLLQGCVGAVVVGSAAVGTKAATDPRTVGTQVDDSTLELRVNSALSKDEQIKKQARINVTAYQGKVLLVGQAPTTDLSSRAKQIAMGVDGATEVYNEIRQGQPIGMGTAASDTWITSKVRTQLLSSDQVKSSNVKVTTENGEVFLLGLVTDREGRAAADIASRVSGERVVIGSHHFVFEDEHCTIPEDEREKFDNLEPEYSHLYLAASGHLAGVICIADPLRPEASRVLRALRGLGITNTVMMTGDSERTAAAIAKQVGVDQFFAEVLPEDKAAFVQKAKSEGHTVVMIGDGINDSPALSAADVGIAINSGAAIAREIADVTIKADSLEELVILKTIANSLQRRVSANYRFVLTFNSALIALGAMGILQPASSAMLHNLSTIGISLKSMTNLIPEEKAQKALAEKN